MASSSDYQFDNFTLNKDCFRNLVPNGGAVPLINVVTDYKWTSCTNEKALREIPKIHLKFYQQTHHGMISTLNRWYLLFKSGDLLAATGLADPSYVWPEPYDMSILGEPICEVIMPFVSNEIGQAANNYDKDEKTDIGYWRRHFQNFNPFISLGIFTMAARGSGRLLDQVGGFVSHLIPFKTAGLLFGTAAAMKHIIPRLDSYTSITNVDIHNFEFFVHSSRKEFNFELELLNTDEEGETNVVRNFEFVNFLIYNLTPRRRNMIVRDVPVVCECFTGTEYLPYAAIDVTVTKKGKSRVVQKGKLAGQTIPDAYVLNFHVRMLMETDGRLKLQALKGFDVGASGNKIGYSNVIGSTKVFTNRSELVQSLQRP